MSSFVKDELNFLQFLTHLVVVAPKDEVRLLGPGRHGATDVQRGAPVDVDVRTADDLCHRI